MKWTFSLLPFSFFKKSGGRKTDPPLETRLNSFHDEAGAEAAGADPDSAGCTPLNGANPLEIGVPAARASVVGVAHRVSHLGSFAANFTCPSHCCPPKKINSRAIPCCIFYITPSVFWARNLFSSATGADENGFEGQRSKIVTGGLIMQSSGACGWPGFKTLRP